MSRFNGARAHIFVWTRACTCILPTWGKSQLGFRVLANRPVRDAHRQPWLAPCRPALKANVVEHRLSKHWDSQYMTREPQWLVRRFQVQVESWLRVGLAGGSNISHGAQKHLSRESCRSRIKTHYILGMYMWKHQFNHPSTRANPHGQCVCTGKKDKFLPITSQILHHYSGK